MKKGKQFVRLLLIVLTVLACKNEATFDGISTDYSILLTKIDNQQLPEGMSMRVHFAAIDNDLGKLTFSTSDLPEMVKLFTHKNGTGYFEINAAEGSEGKYDIMLFAKNGTENGKRSFSIEILPKPVKILYLSPESDNMAATGTAEDPLPSLEKITKSDLVLGRKTVLILLDGHHGSPIINFSNIAIYAATNAKPTVKEINFKKAKNVSITGVEIISKTENVEPKKFLVLVDSLSKRIKINNCEIRTAKNTQKWAQSEWDAYAQSGIMIKGNNAIISNNLFENVFHALQTDANTTLVRHNIIDRFSGDAIRNTGDDNAYFHNCIKNAVVDDYSDEDGNHDDCFQSWTYGAPIRNIVLQENIAISCLEPNLPLKSRVVQGLACFDGFEEGWDISNNLVILDHPHGIALFGAKNCVVENNTILRNPYHFFDFESDPWIMITAHKDGRPSLNNRIQNNYCGALVLKDSLGTHKGNLTINGKYIDYLKDYQGWDFRLK